MVTSRGVANALTAKRLQLQEKMCRVDPIRTRVAGGPLSHRRDDKPESIRVEQTKRSRSIDVGRLGREDAAALFDSIREIIDILIGRNPKRESFALDPVEPFGTVIPVSYTHLRAHETDSYLV